MTTDPKNMTGAEYAKHAKQKAANTAEALIAAAKKQGLKDGLKVPQDPAASAVEAASDSQPFADATEAERARREARKETTTHNTPHLRHPGWTGGVGAGSEGESGPSGRGRGA